MEWNISRITAIRPSVIKKIRATKFMLRFYKNKVFFWGIRNTGDCQASSFAHFYQALTTSEKEVLTEHYGKPDTDCKNTNLCLFVTEDDGLCTSEDTGISGGGKNPPAPPGNGWGEAGTTKTTGIANYWNIVGLIFMIIVFV